MYVFKKPESVVYTLHHLACIIKSSQRLNKVNIDQEEATLLVRRCYN